MVRLITWGRAARAGACPPPEPGAEPRGAQPPARIAAQPARPPALRGQRGGNTATVGEGSPRSAGCGRPAGHPRLGNVIAARQRERCSLAAAHADDERVMVHSGKPGPIHTLERTSGSARPAPAIHGWHQNRSRNSKPESRAPHFPSLMSPNTARLFKGARDKLK